MLLHDAAWAPSPRRVRIYLAEKQIEVPRRTVDLRAGEHMQPAYLTENPRGVVPALELDNGELITESVAICRYFEALQPDPPLFGGTPLAIARIEAWTRRIEAEGYVAVVNMFRNANPAFAGRGLPGATPLVPQIAELATRGRAMWDAFVDTLETQLGESEWVAGQDYTFADISALVAVDFARAAVKLSPPEACTHLARWYAAASARPSAAA